MHKSAKGVFFFLTFFPPKGCQRRTGKQCLQRIVFDQFRKYRKAMAVPSAAQLIVIFRFDVPGFNCLSCEQQQTFSGVLCQDDKRGSFLHSNAFFYYQRKKLASWKSLEGVPLALIVMQLEFVCRPMQQDNSRRKKSNINSLLLIVSFQWALIRCLLSTGIY